MRGAPGGGEGLSPSALAQLLLLLLVAAAEPGESAAGYAGGRPAFSGYLTPGVLRRAAGSGGRAGMARGRGALAEGETGESAGSERGEATAGSRRWRRGPRAAYGRGGMGSGSGAGRPPRGRTFGPRRSLAIVCSPAGRRRALQPRPGPASFRSARPLLPDSAPRRWEGAGAPVRPT